MKKKPWWKALKCSVCRRKIGGKEITAELRLETLDGPVELEICTECAEFLDKSADVLTRKRNERSTSEDAGGDAEDLEEED